MNRLLLLAGAVLLTAGLSLGEAVAVNPDEVLADPVLEERARALSQNLRCLVCQNQSIDDSNADLARDLRIIVRERLVAGDSDDEVMQFVVDRYGDYVLLEPPFKGTTFLLWAGPAILLVLGAAGLALAVRSRRAPSSVENLSEAERKRLAELMKADGGE